jgi:hypothetical protein
MGKFIPFLVHVCVFVCVSLPVYVYVYLHKYLYLYLCYVYTYTYTLQPIVSSPILCLIETALREVQVDATLPEPIKLIWVLKNKYSYLLCVGSML